MKRLMAVLLIFGLCGCSGTQVRQEFLGMSVTDVKNSNTRQTQQYDISSDECLAKIREVLKEMKAIVREDAKQKFIRVDNLQKAFHSSIDTTQVGILVTSWEVNKSQVDVASGNTDLAIFVSKTILEKIKFNKDPQLKNEHNKNILQKEKQPKELPKKEDQPKEAQQAK